MAEQGQGSGWNDPFPRLCWTLVNMRTCRRSLYTPVPAPSCRTLGSCTLLCPTIMGMAGKRAGVAKPDSSGLCTVHQHPRLRVESLLMKSDLASTYTSRNHMQQLSLSSQVHVFSIFSLTSSAVKKYLAPPSYKAENLQKWVFSPPE